ncbi:MAG: ATP-binding protein [Prochloraceae cyanobacterium]|nr:ATP-binding protein [Prochloraceae cyanobacterium]
MTEEVQTAIDRLSKDIAARKAESTKPGIALRLEKLADRFQLSAIDLEIILICLAPELDLRYENLYAYLQGDVTKKRPRVDLVLNLISPSLEAKLSARQRLIPSSPLLKHHLVKLFEDPSQPESPLLSKSLKIDDRIVNYLLDTADIIAGQLGLELYKIDLSSVVSKYIGETEKNLSRIFDEAQTSNAILFFDEADCLFGKRSEVRDSHDRYANIEVSYLLQRMEEYQGIVILATNLRGNLDDAFIRRMHFSVEFPFPNQKDRRRIWEKIWPEDTPCSIVLIYPYMLHYIAT